MGCGVVVELVRTLLGLCYWSPLAVPVFGRLSPSFRIGLLTCTLLGQLSWVRAGGLCVAALVRGRMLYGAGNCC
jgi:hypothetical protein